MIQQLYESNAGLKYPLVDTHEEDIPTDIFLDMSLSVPANVVPVVTAISVTASSCFMSIEDQVSKKGIGHVIVSRPQFGRIYDIQVTMDNAFGWIVLGPGRSKPFTIRDIEVTLDANVILYQPIANSYMDKIEVDGFLHTNIDGQLSITANNPYIKATLENRDILNLPGEVSPVNKRCIVLSRNNAQIPVNVVFGGRMIKNPPSPVVATAASIAGVLPDAAGNINIASYNTDPESASYVEITTIDGGIGFLLYKEDKDDICPKPTKIFTHSRCDEGTQYPFPLDEAVEAVIPKYAKEDCGCVDSSSSTT